MAYKDEYEVARLYTDGEFGKALKDQFDGDPNVKVSLAPPLLATRDKLTGHLRKREFGSWIFRAFDLLTRFKFLRGTAFDPFGYTAERRMERALPGEYGAMIFRHLDRRSRRTGRVWWRWRSPRNWFAATATSRKSVSRNSAGNARAWKPRSASRWHRRPNRGAPPAGVLFHSRVCVSTTF